MHWTGKESHYCITGNLLVLDFKSSFSRLFDNSTRIVMRSCSLVSEDVFNVTSSSFLVSVIQRTLFGENQNMIIAKLLILIIYCKWYKILVHSALIYSNKIGLQSYMFLFRSRQVPHADLSAWQSTTRFSALRKSWGQEPSLLGRNSAILTKNFSIISRLFCLSLVTNCCIYEIFLLFVYFIGLNITS